MFAGTKRLYEPGHELLTGGDVLLPAPGVVAIGTGGQTSPAGLERLARRVLDAGFAHTVLAVLTDSVPGNPVLAAGAGAGSASEPLDMLCTFAGPDTVVMRSAVAYSLVARTITQGADGLRLSHPRPFLEAVADAMGLDRLRVVETGPGPPGPGRPRSGTTRPTCSRSDRRRYFPTSATR
jgi:arginine deiminase